jgi:peptidoglycan/xylan/chitin deacetylase (PgdA/CDA1 family)
MDSSLVRKDWKALMPPLISAIWSHAPPDLAPQVRQIIDGACNHLSAQHPGFIFFRADDVAVPGKQFARLLAIFAKQRIPLCLAVVPAWLSDLRWQKLRKIEENVTSLWCWHQHGWRHMQHEEKGKKQEFGPRRKRADLEKDLVRGRTRLEGLMGEDFFPVFTPPWNRCDYRTLQLLSRLKYVAVSRSQNSKPPAPQGLPDFHVNVDLHTRKEQNSEIGWQNLLGELKDAICSGFGGIMIHHQRMNQAAFDFLEILLENLAQQKNLNLMNFKDLAAAKITP